MKIRLWIIGLLATVFTTAAAQSAKSVLDKTAQVLSNKGGVTAAFTIRGAQNTGASGTIS